MPIVELELTRYVTYYSRFSQLECCWKILCMVQVFTHYEGYKLEFKGFKQEKNSRLNYLVFS
jgi:hypothetical protein